MSPGLTMERIYEALRDRIVSAELAPGTRLDPARLAQDLNASATPVRDALHRLLGERLVDAWPQEGFHVPIISETTLRDLYGWSLDLLLIAIKPAIHPLDPIAEHGDDAVQSLPALFEAIAVRSGNFEHRVAVRNLNARLQPVRQVEGYVIRDADSEAGSLADAWQSRDLVTLRNRLSIYHRRRVKLVPQIAAAMRDERWR